MEVFLLMHLIKQKDTNLIQGLSKTLIGKEHLTTHDI